MTPDPPQVPARRVLALALPALGVLAAEPLYLLVDTAVVGRLGAVPLAALAVGNVVAQVLAAGLFLRALVVERVTPPPSWPAMRAQLGMGRDLVLRTAAFQACFLLPRLR